jgi:hypothetical protein
MDYYPFLLRKYCKDYLILTVMIEHNTKLLLNHFPIIKQYLEQFICKVFVFKFPNSFLNLII